MRIVIAGGHGQVALLLERVLSSAGHTAVGIVRNPAHAADVAAAGATPAVLDLESAAVDEVAGLLRGADAAVFAAGAGPGSGAPRKDTVDRGAAVLLAGAAERAGVRRLLQISSMGAGAPPAPGSDEVWSAYITAKTAAEDDLRARDLDWLILRPGGLTNDPATGLVDLAPSVPRGRVPRGDVAEVTAALLASGAARHTLELVSGDIPLDKAVAAL